MGFFDFFSKSNHNKEGNDITSADQSSVIPQESTIDPFDSYKDIFKTENFKNASIKEKMDAYQALENKMAQEQGRAPRTVVFDGSGNFPFNENGPIKNYAAYSNDTGCIYMNPYYLSDYCAKNGHQFDGINSIIHEGRHAYQYDSAFGYSDKISNDYLARQNAINNSLREDVYNTGSEINNITGTDNYTALACERDAFKYANDTMKDSYFQNIYGNDENFVKQVDADNAYLNHMDNEMYRNEAINNVLSNNPDVLNHHMQNIASGMSANESLNQVFGGENEFENQIGAEIDRLKEDKSPEQKSEDYNNNLAEQSESSPITPSLEQQRLYDMHTSNPDFSPLPMYKSNLNEESEYGNMKEFQASTDNTVYKNPNDLDNIKNDIAEDYEYGNVLNNSNNYFDSEQDEDYAKSKTFGKSGNDYEYRYPNGIQNYEKDSFNPNQNSEFNQEAQNKNYYSDDNGSKPEESYQASNTNYSDDNGAKPEEFYQGSSAYYFDDNGAKPEEAYQARNANYSDDNDIGSEEKNLDFKEQNQNRNEFEAPEKNSDLEFDNSLSNFNGMGM